MNTAATSSPWLFFGLVFGLSIPFWVMGGGQLPLPVDLPVSALILVNPVLAALMLSYWRAGPAGAKELLKKAFDYRAIKDWRWYLLALGLAPLIYFLTFVVMRLTGRPLPEPIEFPLPMAPVFSLMFFVAATAEEIGWSGYAIDPLQRRWGAVTASLLLGMVWQVWHLIGDVQAARAPLWIVWHSLYSIGLRVVMVWIYNHTGKSVLAATLVHATDNVSWAMFPNYGSHYDPFIGFLITAGVAVAVVVAGINSRAVS